MDLLWDELIIAIAFFSDYLQFIWENYNVFRIQLLV